MAMERDPAANNVPQGNPLASIAAYSELAVKKTLRAYQLPAAQTIVESVRWKLGRKLVIEFSRQSGKDELIAQTLAYLLTLNREVGGRIVMANPTAAQGAISRRRLLARAANHVVGDDLRKEGTNGVSVGAASAVYLSAQEGANVRGDTADLLLLCNEAQDVDPDVWDARFDPMAASTDATTVFFGTPWSRHSLLARERRFALEQQERDGVQRLFQVRWEEVANLVPEYGRRVRARMAQLGPQHPFIRTEYCLEEFDGNGALLDATRLALMVGDHPRQTAPEPGRRYALLLDVAGEAEADADALRNGDPRRDSTALTIVEIATPERGGLPTYKVVERQDWQNSRHAHLREVLCNLADRWNKAQVVVDATGIGMMLASELTARLGKQRVLAVHFTAQKKSEIGWGWLACIEAGRYLEYADDGKEDTRRFWEQARSLQAEVLPGPGKLLRWQVPSATLHDDLAISASLCALLDDQQPTSSHAFVREYGRW